MKPFVKHLHFVGIGGSGMSGIAEILHRQGYRVSGSDLSDSEVTRRLESIGLQVFIGHAAAHVGDADVIVTSSAIAHDNPELAAAAARRIPVVGRAQMLAELMRGKTGIAVAGTHGKTTTTALVTSVLAEAGLDPSFVIGGQLTATGSHSHWGRGEHIVVEADESDASFLHLSPTLAVVTNIDADHMETYGHDLARLHAAFVDFIHRLPFYGRAVLCSDDPGVRAIVHSLARPIIAYGLGEGADLRALDVQPLPGGQMRFTARQQGRADLAVRLNLAGEHNVRNALASIAIARELGLSDESVARTLLAFAGVGRRFERHGELRLPAAQGDGAFTLIDDYGHHPVEIAAVLAAARGAFPGRRLVLAFQPHRYSRTRDCFAEFAAVLAKADALLLAEVYAAGESPIAGIDGLTLVHAVQAGGGVKPRFVAELSTLPAALLEMARNGDVVLTMGAGSIGEVPSRLRELAGAAR